MLGIDSIKINQDILLRVSDIDAFRGLWDGLERHTTGLNMLGDFAEYGQRFARMYGPLKEKPVTEELICLIHGLHSGSKEPSAYKSESSQLVIMKDDIPAGILDTAAPEDVQPLMAKLISWVEPALERRDKLHPLMTIAVFTAVFLQISPFEDGNRRLVRFLIMLMMIRAGYTYAPYVALDPLMNDQADQIYRGLRHNQASIETGQPAWDEWLHAFFGMLQAQKEVLNQRLYGKERDLSSLPTLSAKILDLFAGHERLQMKDIIRLTNGRRSTIKLRLGELVDEGYLRRHGQARSTWYSLV